VTSFPYRPGHCHKTYRLIVLRKHLHRRQGGQLLGEESRYFFYITNDSSQADDQLVRFYDQRADQENTIAQLKSGLPAFHAPTHCFLANWAYMVIAALAWNLKAWYGLLLEEPALQQQVLRMEFKQFLQRFIHFPCQLIRQGRYLIYRIVHFTWDTLTVMKIADWFNALAFPCVAASWGPGGEGPPTTATTVPTKGPGHHTHLLTPHLRRTLPLRPQR